MRLADTSLRTVRSAQPLSSWTFVERCHALAQYSQRYPVVVEMGGLQLRRCPHRGYLIFYAVTDHVEIAHIFHGARDYLKVLFPDA